ncbi:starch synthase [Micrococcus cohnii]|uniref:D-inositol 3-phosphate glycosyltransferase n=1 Tax=Micrococcus cohnii TaxID=993416 RepID=A0A7W7M2Z0_9MICC|nr:starch synthase [Micrococcus cohnii]
MRIDIVSKEFPPAVYGGAGVHVAELTRVLASRADVRVHAFGEPREPDFHGAQVTSHATPADFGEANPAVQTLATDLTMLEALAGADVIHSHTWYANMAGHLGALLHNVPHVVSAHSLEPLRPWKAEQLGGGYRVSSWAESTAYHGADGVIAVSEGMRRDILKVYPDLDPDAVHTVHNGIDTHLWAPQEQTDALAKHGVDPDKPSVAFVGRITRQKGVPLLLKAALQLPPEVQLVMCVGAPDTPELAAEVGALIDRLRREREGVVVIEGMLPRADIMQILSQASVFACPSIYEPLGIVNLEAMACGTAVVASAVGGIPEVVLHEDTGLLVPMEQHDDATGTPVDEAAFVADFAAALTRVLEDPELATRMGRAGRERAVEHFSWETIADRTLEVYESVLRV